MPKRFTDTDKWKKPFLKSLPVEYKLLWFYMLDDCDIAGLWQVDFEVAELRIGHKIDLPTAIHLFNDHIIQLDDGQKWFIPSFMEFQYGNQLSKTNNIFKSIDKILSKYNLYQYLGIEISETGTTPGAIRGRVSQKVRDKIFLESEFICQYCSEQKPKIELVVDHFMPINLGGDNSDGNLICSCIRCNSHKTDIAPEIFLSKDFAWLNPTEKIKALNNKLKGAISTLTGAKDKDKDKGTIQGQGIGQGQGQEQGKGQPISKNEIFEELFTDDIWVQQIGMTHKGKDIKQAWEECFNHHSVGPSPPREIWEWKQKLNSWLTIKGDKKQKNGNGTPKQFDKDKLAAAIAARNYNQRTGE